jgi:hypothetical protein
MSLSTVAPYEAALVTALGATDTTEPCVCEREGGWEFVFFKIIHDPICRVDTSIMQFAVFFYGYGAYLHWGYEFDALDAHHPFINTSFQHYCHHAKAILNKPYHCGFYFKIWDQVCSCFKSLFLFLFLF